MIYKPVYGHNKNKIMNDTTSTKIIMDDIPLKQVNSIKFLGVLINDNLTWEDHKRLVYTKISKSIGLLYKCYNIMTDNDCINMYKTFIEPYFIYAIEACGHSILSENDPLLKLQSKVLRILFNCHRTSDAWRHSNGQITDIRHLYSNVIRKLCMKHQFETLPNNFSEHIMPELKVKKLENKITHISLNNMYDYKSCKNQNNTQFKTSCIKHWNSLSFDLKVLPYSSGKKCLHRALKKLTT